MKFSRPQVFFDRSIGTLPMAAIALFAALFSSSAYGADYSTPQQFSDFVQAETVKFASIIEKEGLQMEVK